MTRWRGRVSEEQLVRLLQESLRIAHKTGALRIKDLRQATVDTTVQSKAITFPTDGKLLYRKRCSHPTLTAAQASFA
jgi:IS5 family transposase